MGADRELADCAGAADTAEALRQQEAAAREQAHSDITQRLSRLEGPDQPGPWLCTADHECVHKTAATQSDDAYPPVAAPPQALVWSHDSLSVRAVGVTTCPPRCRPC